MRHLVNTTDFSVSELDQLLCLAEQMRSSPEQYRQACAGRILATLFFEPSTRTRLSFESAMLSLGGNVIGFSEPTTTSATKGECLADTIEMVNGYADIIALRHPGEGAAAVAAAHADVPLINAGDGGHYHPTQTLTDLFTIRAEMGRLENLTIGLCGDLKYGRTVHSLITAMIRYPNIRFVCIAPQQLSLPAYFSDLLQAKKIPCIYDTSLENVIDELDVLYMTRVQRERFSIPESVQDLHTGMVLTPELMARGRSGLRVLHPLPRVDEIDTAVDKDPRACYFRQAHNGRYVRMALIYTLLTNTSSCQACSALEGPFLPVQESCDNPHCITAFDVSLPPLWKTDQNGAVRCVYCEKARGRA